MPYYSEADKAKELIAKYLKGMIIDIGSGGSPITENALAIDGRDYGRVDVITNDLYNLSKHTKINDADVVFSSHCLEHLTNPTSAIEDWAKLLKQGGIFILYLPDRRKYSNEGNPEHMNDWDMNTFLFYFTRVFCGVGKDFTGSNFPATFELIESKEDFREDCYSFLIIAKKII